MSVETNATRTLSLHKLASWRGIRVLAWDRENLYGSRGYELLRLDSRGLRDASARWEPVARFRPAWWRKFTSHNRLTYRLVRDGFHALAVLADGTFVAAVPGGVVTRAATAAEFEITHQVLRGMRPLHITAVPNGNIYWGEYFDNRERAEAHIYASSDRGRSWQVAYTFSAGAIRHIHNIIYDRYADCLWILTGDEGQECKILRADLNLSKVEIILSGNQQSRAVAAIPTQHALYLSTDTPYEQNHVLQFDRRGNVKNVCNLASSSIFGCQTSSALFFSTMVEPSRANPIREVQLVASPDGAEWQVAARWQKDALPMHYFQYGNAILPDGENTTNYLAVTTIAVNSDDLVTTLWSVKS